MKIAKTISEVRAEISAVKRKTTVGFVPTMGYLHEGHLRLVELSGSKSDYQVMSIFVNRMQFNSRNDYTTYPVDIERDIELASGAGVDLLFIPDDVEMYSSRLAFVDIEKITENLCGATRPGHFRGVLTVVAKLFNIVQPDVSVFGQKDIQQAVAISKMVKDLDFPVEIIIAPIVRESDGLAMSSRNKNLTSEGRKNAAVLYRALCRAQEIILGGERQCASIYAQVKEIIDTGKPDMIDYISFVSYEDLSLIDLLSGRCVLAVSAYFGQPKLLDNMVIDLNGRRPEFSV